MILKKYISVFLVVITFTQYVSAGEPSLVYDSFQERQAQHEEFQKYYKIIPSALPLFYKYPISWIGFNVLYRNGHLHDLQNSDILFIGGVNTESFLQFKDKGWTLHGSFEYENGYENGGSSLLSYRFKQNGTPSFYMCKKPADRWKIRKYGVSATVVKDFNINWKLGLLINYVGYQHFRINDVRNNQTELNIYIALTASLRLADKSWISFGPLLKRNKEKPSFSIIYSSGPDYQIFLINGMGTYIKDLIENIHWNEFQSGGILQWNYKKKGLTSLLSYEVDYGNNGWKNTASQISSAQVKWTKYHFFCQRIKFFEKFSVRNSMWEISGKYSYTTGNGSSWERSNARYIDNYRYIGKTLDMAIGWTGLLPVFRNTKLNMAWSEDNRLDKSYNYRYLSSQLLANLSVGLDWRIRKLPFFALLKGGFCLPITVDHLPGAADTGQNIFTEYIGKPDSIWKKVKQVSIGLLLQVDIPFKKNLLEVGINTDTNFYAGGSTLYNGQYYLQSKLFFNVYF